MLQGLCLIIRTASTWFMAPTIYNCWANGYCTSQSSSFNTNIEDIGVLFPAPLHWVTAPSPSCWMLANGSQLLSGELPSTEGHCLTWKVTFPAKGNPTPGQWLTLTDAGSFLKEETNLWCNLSFRVSYQGLVTWDHTLAQLPLLSHSPFLLPLQSTCRHSHNKSNAFKSLSQALLLRKLT